MLFKTLLLYRIRYNIVSHKQKTKVIETLAKKAEELVYNKAP